MPSAVLFMFVRSMNSGIVTALFVLCLSDLSAVWHLARTYMLGCILSLKPPAHALLRRMHAWLRLVFMCACSQRRGCVCIKVCVCVCVWVCSCVGLIDVRVRSYIHACSIAVEMCKCLQKYVPSAYAYIHKYELSSDIQAYRQTDGRTDVHLYRHTHIHTYIPAYILSAYLRMYIHAYLPTYIHTIYTYYIQYIHTSLHPTDACVDESMYVCMYVGT